MESATQQTMGPYAKDVPTQALSTGQRATMMTTGSQDALALAANAHRREHLLNLTPVQVIKKLYDTAIVACKKKDYDLAHRAITQLLLGLNLDCEEMTGGLLGLYMFSKECIRKGDIAEATTVLEELRSAWIQASNL